MTLYPMYLVEQNRVRALLSEYKSIGPAGTFGARMIEDILRRAEEAIVNEDVTLMIQLYAEMKECK